MQRYFEFCNGTKLNCGENALRTLGAELHRYGATAPLIISDAILEKLGTVDRVVAAISESDLPLCKTFTAVPRKVDADIVASIKESIAAEKCDCIVAVGGKTVIDTAKCVKYAVSAGVENLGDFPTDADSKNAVTLPLFAVPTTFGIGAETAGVVCEDEFCISSPLLAPDVAILDASLWTSAPARVTAANGIATLCIAVEAFCNTVSPNIGSNFAATAVELVMKNLENAVKNSENTDAYSGLALASALAGIAYANAPAGICRAIGIAASNVCDISLGEAISTVLPSCLAFDKEFAEYKMQELLFYLAGADVFAATPIKERSEKSVETVRALIARLNKATKLPAKLSETKVQRERFGDIAERAAADSATAQNVRPADTESVLQILNFAY